MSQQKKILDYFSSVEDDLIDEAYVRSLEERIKRLERIVYAENITDLRSLIKVKREEFVNTLTRLSSHSEVTSHIHSSRNTYANKAKQFCILMTELDYSIKKDERIYIDTTQLLLTPYITGIQRVAQQLIFSGFKQGLMPIFHHNNEIFIFDFSEKKIVSHKLSKHDWLLMPNANWMDDNTKSFVNFVLRHGTRIATVIYDLIPLEYPNAFANETSRRFKVWFHESAIHSDMLICISKSVQKDVQSQLKLIQPKITRHPSIEYAYLGDDFSRREKSTKTRFVHTFIADRLPFFISIGTLEPRKGYKIALDAMEELWDEGHNIRYVIVGRYGWLSRNLENRIVSHPEYNKRLFWWQDIPDIDLQELYKSAHALICPSVAEGFGLPIIEAARYGLRSICSDIDIFREIAGESSIFFEVANSQELTMKLREVLITKKTNAIPFNFTWEQTTNRIIELMK